MPLTSTQPGQPFSEADRFQLLVDAVGDYAIFMLDPKGFVASWNSGAQAVKGYLPAEIIGQHFSRFFGPEDQAAGLPEKILSEARKHGRFEAEGWRIRKDGTRFWANAIIRAMHNPRGELIGFAKITRDITERMQAQRALMESEQRFRLLVDGVVDYAIYMLDPSGVIVNWNTGAERLKGYSSNEIVGQHFSRFYTKEDRAAGLPLRVLESATREGRFEAEGWRVRKDGSRFWASVVVDALRSPKGELLGFAKITRDITERRAAQEALRESERQFRLLVRGVSDYALYMLDPNGIITNWNTGAQKIKGYTGEEVIGHHFSRFYTESDRAAGLPARALQMAEQEGRFEAEGWRVRRDGTLFWANVVIDAIRDEEGTLVGFGKITRDITERRQAQLALQEAQAQRAYSQKMEALGQLTGGVAHDFNNLLMIVGGHVQTLKRLAANDPKGLRAAEAIELAAKRGESLTRQLLTFSRRQTLNPVTLSIDQRIDSFRTMLSSAMGGTAKLVTNVLPDIWPITVDVNELELALVNLVLNSRDSMPQGGVISLTAENIHLQPQDTPQHLEGDFVALSVADEGVGIAPDILPRVFDPFFTTKQVNKGTGLGLSQVHGFAHQSGGTVTIRSELGRGTTVTIYIPRAQGKPEPTAAKVPAEMTSGMGVVLLVEDNPDVAEVSSQMLEQLGYRVQVAGDAQTALQALDGGKFELMVSDIVMAGDMDGLALGRTARQRHPDLPILLVTGFSNVAATASAEFAVLRKPYQLADLSRAAAKVIGETRHPPPDNLVQLRQVRRDFRRKPERP